MAILRTYSATVSPLQPLARWRFNETEGNSAIDRVGDLNGTYIGSPQLVPGFIGDGAARLDGADFVQVISSSGSTGSVTVATFGDSLAGGFGVAAQDSFPDDLQDALVGQGLDATVLNRGVNDQTTGGALSRVAGLIVEAPDVVVIVLGTNDARTQVPPETVESNLRSMIEDFQAAGIQVVLTGTFGFFPRFGGYASEADRAAFEQIFPDLASEYGLPFEHFFGGTRAGDAINGGVIGDGQTVDGLHPNAAGVDRIVQNILPDVNAAIDASGAGQPTDDALALPEGAIEMWFTPDQVTGAQALFSKDAAGLGAGQVRAVLQGGRVVVTLESASGAFTVQSGPNAVSAGEPAHLAFVFGAAGILLLVNGALVDQDPSASGGLVGNTQPLLIGRAQTGGAADFEGVIDEVLVYDQALTVQQIAGLHEAGLSGSTRVGGPGDDELIGGVDDDILRGAGGNDVIRGYAGEDKLFGGAGADTLYGGAGDDVIRGGGGRDIAHGQNGDDRIFGGGGNDLLRGNGGDDVIFGGPGDDRIYGGAGNDELRGQGGDDRLFGGPGDDLLNGGPGDDLSNGGPGNDLLVGGAGRDTFQITAITHGIDTIRDFAAGPGGDVLDLAAVLEGFVPGTSDPSAYVRLKEAGGTTEVAVDRAGGGGQGVVVFNLLETTGLSVPQLVDDGNVVLV